MAGEWLKFECSLPEKPETLAITVAMGWDDADLTVGKLMRLFRWFDQQTVDGNARSVTAALLDRIIGVPGFVAAVASVGWIVVDGASISLANFDRHNGATAKSRALTAKRVANHKSNASGNASANGASVSEALPREEKKREDKEDPPNPPSTGGGSGGGEQSPTKAGAVCKAIRAKGVPDVNPSNPELIALIGQGVTVETFEAAAETCAKAKPPKGMAYLLGIVKRQLGEAAAIASGPAATSTAPDPDSKPAVEAEGVRLGLGKWSQIEHWHVYKARVRAAQGPSQGTH